MASSLKVTNRKELNDVWSHPNVPLYRHLHATGDRIVEIIDDTHVSSLFLPLGRKRTIEIDLKVFRALGYLIGAMHDLAKATKYFQEYLRAPEHERKKSELSRHAKLSGLMAFYLIRNYFQTLSSDHVPQSWENMLNDDKTREAALDVLALMGYFVIRQHHGDLITVEDDINKLQELKAGSREVNEVFLKQVSSIHKTTFDDLIKVVFDHGLQRGYLHAMPRDVLPRFLDSFKNWLLDDRNGFLKSVLRLRRWHRHASREWHDIEKHFNVLDATLPDPHLFNLVLGLLGIYLHSALQYGDVSSVIAFPMELRRQKQLSLLKALENYRKNLLQSTSRSKSALSTGTLNQLREQAYNDAMAIIDNITDLKKHRVFSLNLPTGMGKTLTALGAAFRLRDRLKLEQGTVPRIVYVLPFLSIIEQNHQVLEDIMKELPEFKSIGEEKIPTNWLLKHHHLIEASYTARGSSGVSRQNLDDDFTPNDAQFLISSWSSELIITTFHQLLHGLLSHRKAEHRKHHATWNAILILDEIQTIPTRYWDLVAATLLTLVRWGNVWIIFSTATMPTLLNLDMLTSLVPEERFSQYWNELNRVNLIINLEQKGWNEFTEWVKNLIIHEHPTENIAFIMNTIRAARNLAQFIATCRNELPERQHFFLYYLSTHLTPHDRLRRIQEIKTFLDQPSQDRDVRIILVTTQLIEAGVDLDFDMVVRDFAPLDSIIQSAGRCNRHQRRHNQKGTVYLIRLVDDEKEHPREFSSYIYDKSLMDATKTAITLAFESMGLDQSDNGNCVDREHQVLEEIHFHETCKRYHDLLREYLSQKPSRDILTAIATLDYESLSHFKLIEEDVYKTSVFVIQNDEAEITWKAFTNLSRIRDPLERHHAFLKLKNQLAKYMINVPQNQAQHLPLHDDRIPYIPREMLPDHYVADNPDDVGFLPRELGDEDSFLIF